ncbi:MAG: tetratricopeptide repeat protein [Candidatus Omnitrophota bacterium]
MILLLLAAVAVCYGTVLDAGFLWDDEYLVLRNPLLRAPIWSFQVFKQDIVNSNFTYTIYYRPIQILSYAVDYRLAGMDPAVFHFTNILLHFLNGVLVFFLVRKITRGKAAAVLTSLFFLIHPAQAGAVSYVSGRADLLFVFFGLLCMLFYILFLESERKELLAASVIFFIFSLLCKEMALVLPFLLLFMDAIVLRRTAGFRITRHFPYFFTAGIYFALHWSILGNRYPTVIRSGEMARNLLDFLKMAGDFFVLGIAPIGLQIRKSMAGAGISPFVLILTGLLIVLIVAILRRDRRILLFSLGFFIIALVPLSFVMGQFKVLAEHWLYLASFGLFLFMSVAVTGICERWKAIGRFVFTVFVFLGVFFYSSITIGQNIYWLRDADLSERVLSYYGDDPAALHFRALGYLKNGMGAKSMELMRKYVETRPGSARAWYLKGRISLAAGDIDVAEGDFEKALSIDPGYENACLGSAMVAFARGDGKKGIEMLERAVSMNPGYSEAYVLLVTAYALAGEDEKAFLAAKNARKVNPYDFNSLVNLGTAYARKGDMQKAAEFFLEAAKLYPERPDAFYDLGKVFYAAGQGEEAENWLRRAIMVDPGYEPAVELLQKLRRGSPSSPGQAQD